MTFAVFEFETASFIARFSANFLASDLIIAFSACLAILVQPAGNHGMAVARVSIQVSIRASQSSLASCSQAV